MQRYFLFLFFPFFGSFQVVRAQNQNQKVNQEIQHQWQDKAYVDSLLDVTKDKAFVYEELSAYFLELRDYDQALDYLLDAYEWNKMSGNENRLNLIEFHLAQLYFHNANPTEALVYALKSQTIFEREKMDSLKFESNFLIGQIYLDQNRLTFAKDYTQEVFEYGMSTSSDFLLGRAYFLKAQFELKKGNTALAKTFLTNSQKLFKKINESEYIADTYFVFGEMSLKSRKFIQSKGYFEQAYKHLSLSKNNSRKIDILLKMGGIDESLGEKERGVELYKQALDIAQDLNSPHQTALVAKELMRTSLELKENEKAREYLILYNELSDSIIYIDSQSKVANKTAEKQLKSKERAIENYQKALNHSDKIIYGTVFIAILLLVVLILLYYNYKRRKQIVEQEKSLLKSKQDLAEVELQQTKKALENNNENLKSITTLLIEKNAQIKTLMEQIEELRSHNSFSSLSDDKVRKVNDLLEFKILTDDDWHEFRKLYNQVYEGVQAKLKIHHPNLTKSEVKLFMISKLNLNLEEAAGLLAISPESVRKARYRLKKKLELTDKDLQEYIIDF
ncbi:MAG: tetratricopeptide repeat protein [Flavobacteriales bacterium]